MKLFLLLLVIGAPVFAISQEGNLGKPKIYTATIAHVRPGNSSGFLAAVKDSAIWLTPTASSIRLNAIEKGDLEKLPYHDIELVMIKRKGATGRGLVFGALTGLAAGALTGLILGGDPPCIDEPPSLNNFFGAGSGWCRATRLTAGNKAAIYGSLGAVVGGLTGVIIGSVARKRFVIGGRKDKYKEMQLSVMDLMYHNTSATN